MKSYIVILFLFQILSGFAQENTNFKVTCYPTKSDYFNKLKGEPVEVEIVKRSNSDLRNIGGGEFKILSHSSALNRNTLNKEIFAIQVDTTIYVNTFPFNNMFGYGKLQYIDTFCIVEYNVYTQNMGYYFGLIGAAISEIARRDNEIPKFHILFAKNRNLSIELYPRKIEKILNKLKNKDALNQFKEEKNLSVENLIQYYKYYLSNKESDDPEVFKNTYPND